PSSARCPRNRLSLTDAPTLFSCLAPATSDIYTLSLHDALPISIGVCASPLSDAVRLTLLDVDIWKSADQIDVSGGEEITYAIHIDRKSTRLNSSHVKISYAVFCLKKKKTRPRPCA